MPIQLSLMVFLREDTLKTWWPEAIIADILMLIMHMTFRSSLFVDCIQEIKDMNSCTLRPDSLRGMICAIRNLKE